MGCCRKKFTFAISSPDEFLSKSEQYLVHYNQSIIRNLLRSTLKRECRKLNQNIYIQPVDYSIHLQHCLTASIFTMRDVIKFAFSNRVINNWNSLPAHCINTFKTHISVLLEPETNKRMKQLMLDSRRYMTHACTYLCHHCLHRL